MVDDRLRVCLDYSPVANVRTGLGRYAEKLGRHLLEQGDVEVSFYAATPTPERLPAYTQGRLRAEWRWGMRRWRLSALAAGLAGLRYDRHFPDTDLVHCTEHLLVPLARIPSVLTIHDVVYLTHPEWHLPLNRWFLALAMPLFARRTRAIIAVSEYTRREVVQLLHVDPAKVHVVYEAADARFRPVREPAALDAVCARYGLRRPYILYVGAIEPRKNLPLLLRAFSVLARDPAFHHQLVIAGGKGWLYDEVYATAAQLNLGERLRFTGFVADDDLPALYSAADIAAHPAHFEGFGLPPLEAMACGTPVIASAATSLPEVVGDAGLLVPPYDERAWAEALRRVATDRALHHRLAAQGLAQAARFSWEETARRTVEVYRAAQQAF
ncbi:MAG TPA: glycosyltransferase family 1 protein [Anaerolineae bacterium]|nr:glycosyltransferase family 1 protein [Anaerolineae bacterium]HOR00769.1 glycosyltransferase family 1 protein [Anaerolineae bacterium]HPL29403.1 glycosyltransferase family 1 protein [Anaerolineae bacterium]